MLHVVPHSFPTRRSSDLGVVTTGTIRRVDTATRVVNLSHGPIPAIGWPAMTMDFNVAPEVTLSSVQPGQAVRVTLVPAAGGPYTVSSQEHTSELQSLMRSSYSVFRLKKQQNVKGL